MDSCASPNVEGNGIEEGESRWLSTAILKGSQVKEQWAYLGCWIASVILIGVGGWVATYGWQLRSRHLSKMSLVHAIVGDVAYNRQTGIGQGFTWRMDHSDPNVANTPVPPYPLLRGQSISEGVSSSSLPERKYPGLPDALAGYDLAIRQYNRLIDSRNQLAPAVIYAMGPKTIPGQYEVIRQSRESLLFAAEHERVRRLIEQYFPGKLAAASKSLLSGEGSKVVLRPGRDSK